MSLARRLRALERALHAAASDVCRCGVGGGCINNETFFIGRDWLRKRQRDPVHDVASEADLPPHQPCKRCGRERLRIVVRYGDEVPDDRPILRQGRPR